MPKTKNHIITKNKPVISDGSAVKEKHDVEKKPAIESETAIENFPSTEDESGSDDQSTAEKHFEPDASTSKAESDTSINASSDTFDVTSGQLTVTARVLMTKFVASSSSSGEGLHTFNNAVRAALAVTTRALARLSETQEQAAGAQDELEDTLEDLAHVRNELDGTQDQLERAQENLVLAQLQVKETMAQLQVKETMAQLNGTQGELTGFGEAIGEMEEGLRELCERLVHVLRV
ncbi:hypothetical protein BG000_000171 [Podila horticola]|nr:hypothetical protein BG000_000171 [Podila horticola]